MCKWVIKYTAAPFPQWGGGGGGRKGAHLPLAIRISLLRFSKMPFALFDRWHKQTSLQSVIDLWQCAARLASCHRLIVKFIFVVFSTKTWERAPPPNFCFGGYGRPCNPPPAPPMVTFCLIFNRRRCAFSGIDVVSKSNSVLLIRCSTVFFLTEKEPNSLLCALFIDVVKDGNFLALNVNFNETTQHVRRERPLRAGNMFVKAFEVSTDLDLGRIHGHLFPCH